MSILKDIPELISANIISQETAEKIQEYYKNKGSKSNNKLLIVFGILGSLLVGLGIILIIAHNWDNFSKTTKTIFAFLPLIIGQTLCGYTLYKKSDNVAWKESSSTFLFFAIGANISLIGQIYNFHGNLSLFLLTWVLLFFPIIYLMNSSSASLLYIIGITYYACETGYWSYPVSESINYWFLLLIVLPYYYLQHKYAPDSNFTNFHNWVIPLSVIISLGIIGYHTEELLFIAYFSLFSLFYLMGNVEFTNRSKINSYKFFGSFGSIVILLILSFDWFWQELRDKIYVFNEVIFSLEFFFSFFISIIATVLLLREIKKNSFKNTNPVSFSFLIFILIFFVGLYSSLSVILINLFTFVLGLVIVKQGNVQNHLGVLNNGLLVITALIICRFFDTDLSFITRGILFITVGIGFFISNYWLFKKRQLNEK